MAECACGRKTFAKGMCHRCYNADWNKRNPDMYRAQQKRSYERHREERRKKAARYQRRQADNRKQSLRTAARSTGDPEIVLIRCQECHAEFERGVGETFRKCMDCR